MPDSPSVFFALTGDLRRNSRAIKQIRLLVDLGCRVEAVGFAAEEKSGTAVDPFPSEVRVRLIGRPAGTGPRFFYRVHRALVRAASHANPDVFHASDLYVLPALAGAARRTGARLAFDAREMYPHVASTRGRPAVSMFWHAVQQRYLPRTDAVFTVSDSIARWLTDTYGVEATLLYNAPVLRPLRPTRPLRARLGLQDERPVFLHQGSMQKDRGGRVLIEAMTNVENAVLVFLGGGPLRPALEALVRTRRLGDRVYFLDPVPPDDLLDLTATADIGVTFLEDTCLNHRYALPNKLFEYLAAGLPVFASDLPEIRSVVIGFEVGRVVDPNRPETLPAALSAVAADADQRARWRRNAPRVFETFGWRGASQRMATVYRRLLAPPSS